jgi:Zn-dependent protease/CBS domain-containing protein
MFKNAVALPFRLLGIPVKLDTSFLLILPLIAWLIGSQIPAYAALLRQVGLTVDTAALQQGLTPYVLGLSAAIGLFASVVVHELGHAVAARLYGVETREITLWFLGGVAQFDEMPRQRGAEAVVAIAGPVTSVALAGLLWLAWTSLTLPGAALVVLFYLSIMNGFLAIFNLLPALPLDGGRVLRSLLALRMDHVRATRLAAGISQVLAVLLGVFGLLRFQIFTVVLAFFIYNAARAERHYAVLSRTFEDLRVRDLMTREVITVEPEMPLRQFVQLGHFKRFVGYPVVDAAGTLRGFAKLKDAQDRLEQDEGAVVRDVMLQAQTIAAAEEAMTALRRIAESETGRLVVVDESGRMVGLLSKTDLIGHLQAAQGQRARDPEAGLR